MGRTNSSEKERKEAALAALQSVGSGIFAKKKEAPAAERKAPASGAGTERVPEKAPSGKMKSTGARKSVGPAAGPEKKERAEKEEKEQVTFTIPSSLHEELRRQAATKLKEPNKSAFIETGAAVMLGLSPRTYMELRYRAFEQGRSIDSIIVGIVEESLKQG